MPLALAVACANIYSGCIYVSLWLAVIFLLSHTSLTESDPEGEAPEEIQTLWQQQDVSELLVCLYNVSLFVCAVTFTTMKLMANS